LQGLVPGVGYVEGFDVLVPHGGSTIKLGECILIFWVHAKNIFPRYFKQRDTRIKCCGMWGSNIDLPVRHYLIEVD